MYIETVMIIIIELYNGVGYPIIVSFVPEAIFIAERNDEKRYRYLTSTPYFIIQFNSLMRFVFVSFTVSHSGFLSAF